MRRKTVANQKTVPQKAALGTAKRRYLNLTAGVAGAAIMIVEILGAKVLAPYVGTSHFVWTAQIAVTLAALALGYFIGGKLSDSGKSLDGLYSLIAAASLWLVFTIALSGKVAYLFLELPLAFSSLFSSAVLFFVPLCLLATTGPYLLRTITFSLNEVGGNSGRLSAISTIGSFAGTAVIGYVLIPLMPNSMIMLGTSFVLAVLSAVYFVFWARQKKGIIILSFILIIEIIAGFIGINSGKRTIKGLSELYRGNSNFGLLQVFETDDSSFRYYLNDYLVQNTYDFKLKKSVSMFTYMLEGLAQSYTESLDDVLCIGMGIGIVPRDLAAKGSRVDVVEINPSVVPVAEKYFDLDTKAFSIFIGDGRYFVNRTSKKYDAVILDAFLGDSIPTQLLTKEAFEAMGAVLKPDGVLVINSFVDQGNEKDYFGTSLFKTLSEVFPGIRVHGARSANTLFVASKQSDLKIIRAPDFSKVHKNTLSDVEEAFASTWKPDLRYGIVLSDDYNPIEYFDAANRENLRRGLALFMRGNAD